MGFHFAFDLVGSFVQLLDFVIVKFYLGLTNTPYVCRKLFSRFAGVENDLHREYIMIDYNILILL